MNELKAFLDRKALIDRRCFTTLSGMDDIAAESLRVAEVAHNSRAILDDIDREFEELTGLYGKDVAYLFFAVFLQMARIVILNELTREEKAGANNRNESILHKLQKELLEKFDSGDTVLERPYFASMRHITSSVGVPYDAVVTLTPGAIRRILGKGKGWDFDIQSVVPKEPLNLFKGANHRFSTLGHDPLLGLIFGTGNIMTNTITCVKTPVLFEGIKIPVLTTNHVIYTSDFTDPRIAVYGSTAVMLEKMIERTVDDPSVLIASLIKQIIHIGTDLYTCCGISIPCANLVLTNKQVQELTKLISAGDLVKIGASIKLAELINLIIGSLHMLAFNPESERNITQELYSVRTRKIITYSNAIATSSNVAWVAANMYAGNSSAISRLDIGGLVVAYQRMMKDEEIIRKIKEEFVFNRFDRLIRRDDGSP